MSETPIERKVTDGTEERKVTLRLRETGLREILQALGDGGHCNTGTGRLLRWDEDKKLYLDFCFNVGSHKIEGGAGIKAMEVHIQIPLTEDELKLLPKEKHETTSTSTEPAPAVPAAAPAVVPPEAGVGGSPAPV